MESLSTLFERRRAELDAAEADLRKKLADIAEERAALRRAEIAAQIGGDAPEAIDFAGARKIRQNTIMDAVIKILVKSNDGLIALDILAELNKNRSEPLVRTSLSPQLSRLKQAGYIELDGSTWRIAGRGKKPRNDLFGEQSPKKE